MDNPGAPLTFPYRLTTETPHRTLPRKQVGQCPRVEWSDESTNGTVANFLRVLDRNALHPVHLAILLVEARAALEGDAHGNPLVRGYPQEDSKGRGNPAGFEAIRDVICARFVQATVPPQSPAVLYPPGMAELPEHVLPVAGPFLRELCEHVLDTLADRAALRGAVILEWRTRWYPS